MPGYLSRRRRRRAPPIVVAPGSAGQLDFTRAAMGGLLALLQEF